MRLIVFDCDGTLVDSQQAIVSATETTLAAFGLSPPPREAILHAVGLPVEAAMRRHAPDIADDQLAQIVQTYKDSYYELSQQTDRGQVMFPGMRDLICDLATISDIVLAIVTMKSRRGLNRVVEVYDIRDYFQSLKSADDGRGKPAPDLLLAAMHECGVAAADTVMVGDTGFDMLMAKSAGAGAIGVGWGYQTTEELRESGADMIAHTPQDLRGFLHLPTG